MQECHPNSFWTYGQASASNNPTGSTSSTQQYHPHSSWTYGQAPNVLEQMDKDQYAHLRKDNQFYPFQGSQEWGLAKFLNETLSIAQTDRFLKLDWVSQCWAPTVPADTFL